MNVAVSYAKSRGARMLRGVAIGFASTVACILISLQWPSVWPSDVALLVIELAGPPVALLGLLALASAISSLTRSRRSR